MEYYLALKLIHIISSTLLFGTGLGTAFYMWRADCSRNLNTIATVSKNVVLADWIFTTPAVIVQPLSGLAMLFITQMPLTTSWVVVSLILYVLVGLCWLPVVWIQIQVAKNAQKALLSGASMEEIDESHKKYMRTWYALGWPAFIGVMIIFYLMVFKPTLW